MKFLELTDEEYQSFIEEGHESAFFQMIENKKNREMDRQEVKLVGVKDDSDKVIAACLFTLQPTVMGKYFYYSNRGPVLDYHNLDLVRFFFEGLTDYLSQNKCSYVKVDPNWIYKKYDKDVNEKTDYEPKDDVIELLESLGYAHEGFTRGYSKTSQARWMSVLDMSPFNNEQELIKSFDSQRKRNMKKVQKYGVELRFLEVDEIDKFVKLYADTSERQGFFTHPDPKRYFSNFKKAYGDKVLIPYAYIELDKYVSNLTSELEDVEGRLVTMQAKENKNDKTLNKIKELEKQVANLTKDLEDAKVIHDKEGNVLDLAAGIYFETPYELVYNSGASTSEYPQFVGPYKMHLEMMKYCIDNNIDRYNFYGVSGDFSEDGEDYGVYRFKRGFNAEIEELVGDFVKVIAPFQHNVYKVKAKLGLNK
ncbi:aminoacyltransferase [Jeotgalicoccus huakuii]|nr:aminoacyltransferase [Jeotgalicoccus huakuii]